MLTLIWGNLIHEGELLLVLVGALIIININYNICIFSRYLTQSALQGGINSKKNISLSPFPLHCIQL